MMKRNIILIVCLCSIIIVMTMGLLFDFRFITIIKRSFISITVAIIFGCLLGIIIEKNIEETPSDKTIREKHIKED